MIDIKLNDGQSGYVRGLRANLSILDDYCEVPQETIDEVCKPFIKRQGVKMILPYYRIEKTEEGKQFFYSHRGYFNFWDEYLIMNIDEGNNKLFSVLVNRTGRKFSGIKNNDYIIAEVSYIKESVQERKPEEMFEDFPELQHYDYLI